ncbi:MAG: acyltransferase [Desulfovibrionaceae bacterium]
MKHKYTTLQYLLFGFKKIFFKVLCLFTPSKIFRRKLRNIIQNSGENNKIIIIKDGREYTNRFFMVPNGLSIEILGNNNTIKLWLPMSIKNSLIFIHGNTSTIEIGARSKIRHTSIYCGQGNEQVCVLGKNTNINGAAFYIEGNTRCIVGDNCLFSSNITIRASDSHSIFDNNTYEILNKQKNPLIIGDNCWIGYDVGFTKNAQIPNNTIVAMSSLVSGIFTEEHTLLAGFPAKVIKTNVSWDENSIYHFEKSTIYRDIRGIS